MGSEIGSQMKVEAQRITQPCEIETGSRREHISLEGAGFSVFHYNCKANNPAGGPS